MDFITIDFETATSQRDSPCEIGLTFVKDNEIQEVKSWLIKPYYYPYFDGFNVSIHGITPDDVKEQPNFHDLWSVIKPLIEGNFLIAHNAGFDMSVLRKTLELYKTPFPDLSYSCSYIFSKKVWSGLPAYDLKTLCRHNGIPLVHHRAGYDSEATAKLAIKAFEKNDVRSIDEFPSKLRTVVGKLFEGGYRPSITKRIEKINEEIVGDVSKHDSECIFYEKSVVFTGTLMSMKRRDAQQIIADVGGINEKGVTKKTDFLVVGQQDYRVVGDDGMSSKQEKAIKLIEQGGELEVISEEEFLKSLP